MATLRELVIAAVVAAVLAIFVRTFFVQAFRIPSDSMAPGLLAGDHVLVNKFIYGHATATPAPPTVGERRSRGIDLSGLLPMRSVRRGDVVVFRSPREPRQNLIKRCLGLPGEELALDGRQLRIDGRPLDESGYVQRAADSARPASAGSFGPAVVPGDRFFFLGDHRSGSRDSRSWGPISAQSFTGRAWVIYWSVRPRDPVVESRGLWGKIISPSSAGWLKRCRWRRFFKLIR